MNALQQQLAQLHLYAGSIDGIMGPKTSAGIAAIQREAGLPQTALRVAGHRVLDLDHVGTPFGEHRARGRDEAVHRNLENADAFQRPGHATPGTRLVVPSLPSISTRRSACGSDPWPVDGRVPTVPAASVGA